MPLIEEFASLVRYRELVGQLISRSIKTRYKRSVLGIAWTMVYPLLTMAVLTLVFSSLFRTSKANYALYVLSGLMVWNFFAQSSTAAVGDLVWSGGLIGRIFVPKTVFAVSAIGTGLVNLGLSFIPYALIAGIMGETAGLSVLFLVVPILCLSLMALGMGLMISSAAVYFADVMPTYEVLLLAWMYLTPVIYPVEVLPENVQSLLRFNPLFYPLEQFRMILLDGEIPDPQNLLIGLLSAVLMLLVGWWLFTRRARDYAYRI